MDSHQATVGWFPRSPRDRSIREAPSCTPAASPRLRRRLSPWPPRRRNYPASELTSRSRVLGCHALHTGPYPPGWSRLRCYGASSTGSLSLHLLTSLDRPAPSGSPSATCLCRGRLPPSPAFPGSGCPRASIRPLRRPDGSGLSPLLDQRSASWRTAPPRRKTPLTSGSGSPDAAHALHVPTRRSWPPPSRPSPAVSSRRSRPVSPTSATPPGAHRAGRRSV